MRNARELIGVKRFFCNFWGFVLVVAFLLFFVEHNRVRTFSPRTISFVQVKHSYILQVADDVESSLTTEIDVIKKSQGKMRKLIDKTHVQLRMNKAAQVACEADAKDKHHAQNVDDLMHQLHTSSNSLSLYPGVEGEVRVSNLPHHYP